ncbi:MAG: hypothetical protein JSR36_10200 [Proteobacteria bacterium]|nr:hypothetical protein [Pseudomonadota bacterium]
MLSALAVFGCGHRPEPPRRPELTIQLRWIKGYPAETRRNVETGMDWALSFLGATLPSVSQDLYSWHGNVVTLDLDAAGLAPEAAPAWIALLATLKASDEYRRVGALDIGRFVTLTLCSSPQYFALTGASPSFAEFQARHPQERKSAAVVESGIAKGNRLVEIGPPGRVADIFFVAFEGTGSIADGSFNKVEIETLDFMPNGQLRFGLYDLAGHQKPGTTPELTDAGKPSKCLWCHEINLQQPYKNVTDLPGYYSTAEFRNIVRERMNAVRLYRANLKSRVDFSRTNDHTYAELLYLSFAEPSAARLALEWNEPEAKIRQMLAGSRTHAQRERPVLGDQLYDRADIDRFAPYQTIRVPSQLREAGGYDPDLIKQDAAAAADPGNTVPRAARGP